MVGVAEGSDLPLEDVALVNVRYEILFAAFAEETADGSSGSSRTRSAARCASSGCSPARRRSRSRT
jgi:hypothetical protein